MAENKTHKWSTVHDTENRTMTHEFDLGFAVVVDFGRKKVSTAKDGAITTSLSLDGFSLTDYENFLLQTEAAVEMLKSKGYAERD